MCEAKLPDAFLAQAKHLTVLQRTAQYSLPANNHEVAPRTPGRNNRGRGLGFYLRHAVLCMLERRARALAQVTADYVSQIKKNYPTLRKVWRIADLPHAQKGICYTLYYTILYIVYPLPIANLRSSPGTPRRASSPDSAAAPAPRTAATCRSP